MLRVLLKKQITHFYAALFIGSKNEKKGTKKARILLIGIALIYCVGILAFGVGWLAKALCAPLCAVGLDWLYFSIIGLLATLAGVFGSIFTAYSSIYKAKDNDLLFSLPIPARTICLARMSGVYLFTMLFEVLLLIPAEVIYCMEVQVSPIQILCFLPTLLLTPVFAFTLACLLGALLARVSGLFRNKTVVQVVAAVLLMALYYFCYFKAQGWFQTLIRESASLEHAFRTVFYPFYLMGKTACADLLPTLLYLLMTVLIATAAWLLLSRNLIRLGTVNKGERKRKEKAVSYSACTPDQSLFRMELRRFATSAAFILNAGIMLLLFPIGCVVLPIYRGDLLGLLEQLPMVKPFLPAILCGAVLLMLTMCPIGVPTVTLENKTLWLLKSLPVDPKRILHAKVRLHLLLCGIPMLPFLAVALALLPIGVFDGALVVVAALLFLVSSGFLSVLLGLKFPNPNAINETAAVKSSFGIFLYMFGQMGLLALMGGAFYLYWDVIGVTAMLGLCVAVLAALTCTFGLLLRTYGSRMWEKLSV